MSTNDLLLKNIGANSHYPINFAELEEGAKQILEPVHSDTFVPLLVVKKHIKKIQNLFLSILSSHVF